MHSLHLEGAGERGPNSRRWRREFREHEGPPGPLPGPSSGPVWQWWPRGAWESSDSGQGQSAGRGWRERKISSVRLWAGKVSPAESSVTAHAHTSPLLLRPISMLNCSLWPPGQGYGGVRTHQCGESGQGTRERTPTLCSAVRLRPR